MSLEEVEEQLVSLWASVLDMGTEKIGIRHNFFELGGNSIKAITLQNKIKAVFGIRIKLEQFFRAPSIQEMAQTIATLNSKNIEKPTMTV